MSLPHQFVVGIRFAALVTLLGAAGCHWISQPQNGSTIRRPARGTPSRFVNIGPWTGDEPRDTMPGSGCLGRMYDFSNGTQLTLISSPDGRVGDYSVPDGRYGVGPGEAMRLNCNTGRVIGVVPRTE
jgi:hypothetical protein